MMERMVFLVVPGPTDKAFYKSMLKKLACATDLDSGKYGDEKSYVIDRVLKPYAGKASQRLVEYVRRISCLRVYNRYVFIKYPHGEDGTEARLACTLARLFAPLSPRWLPMEGIVVVSDMEDRDAAATLNSLTDSLRSNCARDLGRLRVEETGEYYRVIRFEKASFPILLVAQGINKLPYTSRHAVEDYALFMHRSIVEEKIIPALHSLTQDNKKTHKKLAMLLAVSMCSVYLEELFHHTDKRCLRELVESHDGLRKLMETVTHGT